MDKRVDVRNLDPDVKLTEKKQAVEVSGLSDLAERFTNLIEESNRQAQERHQQMMEALGKMIESAGKNGVDMKPMASLVEGMKPPVFEKFTIQHNHLGRISTVIPVYRTIN